MRKYLKVFLGMIIPITVLLLFGYLATRLVKKLDLGPKGNNIELTEEDKERMFGDVSVGVSSSSEKIELKGVDKNEGSGVATREFVGGSFIHTVVAQLVEPSSGRFYAGWLVQNGEIPDIIYTGKLENKKGGWVVEYIGKRDLSDHSEVWVTLEVVDDQKPEVKILEGNF